MLLAQKPNQARCLCPGQHGRHCALLLLPEACYLHIPMLWLEAADIHGPLESFLRILRRGDMRSTRWRDVACYGLPTDEPNWRRGSTCLLNPKTTSCLRTRCCFVRYTGMRMKGS